MNNTLEILAIVVLSLVVVGALLGSGIPDRAGRHCPADDRCRRGSRGPLRLRRPAGHDAGLG